MFWGLIMEPQKKYSQTVKKSFHISMASLDLCSCTDENVQVMCGFNNKKYLLCTLKKDGLLQCPLDLNFEVGNEVSFVTNGGSHVHLTGYLNDDVMDDLDDLEEEEEVEIDETNIVSGKRPKKITKNDLQSPAKKQKTAAATATMKLLEEINSQDEDDSDDSDVHFSDVVIDDDDDDDDEGDTFLEDDDDDDDEEGDEEEGTEEENDDEDEEEEDEDSDEEVSSMSEEEKTDKPKQNGTSKKGKDVQTKKQQNKKEPETPSKLTKKEAKAQKKETPAKSPKKENASPQKRVVEGGVIVEDIKIGDGALAKGGKVVLVYYEGRFKNNNKMFDSSTKGNGFKFRLGRQEVIKGWDIGVVGMKVGGKRRIVCPPNMAYGPKGSPPVIPPNSTLVFEIELKNVN